jgi:hypothetical protein
MTVEAMVEIRPRRGLPERVWLTEGGAPKQALSGTAEVRILGEGGEAPAGSPELLAARLEVERLRAALEDDARAATGVDGRCMACGADIGHGVTHRDSCGYSVLSAPPPDLGPLRELVAVALEISNSGVEQTDERISYVTVQVDRQDWQRLPELLGAVLDAYPCLGEE